MGNVVEEKPQRRGIRDITHSIRDKFVFSVPPGNEWDQGISLDFSEQDFDQFPPEQTTESMQRLVAGLQEYLAEGWSPVTVLQGKPTFGDNRSLAIIVANPSRKESVPESGATDLSKDFLKEGGEISLLSVAVDLLKGADYKPWRLSSWYSTTITRTPHDTLPRPKHVQLGVAYIDMVLHRVEENECHEKKPLFSPRTFFVGGLPNQD